VRILYELLKYAIKLFPTKPDDPVKKILIAIYFNF